ncbi:hypothetical protein NCAS_0I01180 [Naumovozyma castellii]|uniref:Exocyst complex component EXO84 n=1 Tax=Naumovozyma castellii TaxID=27288 RepID=G0VJV4_NAUCA|nr:hypothetical protein NCAS_0I01180 [Naumovozyma castellii CBS 4309]CCC71786.1 hypothetical protein NCAS_0I01180 [Naumovozyma castellii CBS 4309]
MVDFSLRKARNNWKSSKLTSPIKQKTPSSPSKTHHTPSPTPSSNDKPKKRTAKTNKGANPYSTMQMTSDYSSLPTMDSKSKNKVATSMQRRLSIHNSNYVPPKLDYSMPLPSMSQIPESPNKLDTTSHMQKPLNTGRPKEARSSLAKISQPKTLRSILSNPSFNAKNFVHENLSEANAIDIDQFTSNLTNLAEYVSEEIKRNINDSYHEIMNVNKDLNVAMNELKQLRINIVQLSGVMEQFETLAQRRLDLEYSSMQEHENEDEDLNATQSQRRGNSTLLPPMKSTTDGKGKYRDRSSVMILEKVWDEELTNLFKNIEGIQKFINNDEFKNNSKLKKNARHLLLESNDWMELNVNTLKPFQNVKIFILNDLILVVAGKHGRDLIKQNEFVVSQCVPLGNVVGVTKDKMIRNRLYFDFGNGNHCLYENRTEEECDKVMDRVRKAKDDLCDIFQTEQENSRKIRESFKYLQSQNQQTPSGNKDMNKSPMKSQRRSLGMTPHRMNSLATNSNNVTSTEQFFLQTLSFSMHSRTRSHDMNSISRKLKKLDDSIEEVDIELTRLKFDIAVDTLLDIESQLTEIFDKINDEDLMLHKLISLKVDQRRELIISKLSQNILFSNNEISQLMTNLKTMIKLGLPEQSLDLFLTNRSNLIQDLILQIGSFDNSTNYLTQLAVIRFQTMKQTVLNFEQIFQKLCSSKISSILVSWCNEEVDKYFRLVDQQLLNDENLSIESIKASRKQLDDLKSVGLDFVYKLDEFIKSNSSRIG